MLKMLFNPNILEFWQVLMGSIRSSGRSRLEEGAEDESGIQEQGLFDELLVPEGFKGTYRGISICEEQTKVSQFDL